MKNHKNPLQSPNPTLKGVVCSAIASINGFLGYQKTQYSNFEVDDVAFSQYKEREKHFKEHVIDSIPFHENILSNHQKKLETIKDLMPLRKYKKIAKISQKHKGTPDFMVQDKMTKEIFFVADQLDEEKKHWINLVRDVHKLSDVIILKK